MECDVGRDKVLRLVVVFVVAVAAAAAGTGPGIAVGEEEAGARAGGTHGRTKGGTDMGGSCVSYALRAPSTGVGTMSS